MSEVPNPGRRSTNDRQKISADNPKGRVAQRAILAATLGAGLSAPLAASAQDVPTEHSPRVLWNISAGLTGVETNLTDVPTGVIPPVHTETATPTCTDNPSGHGLGTCHSTAFPSFPKQTPPGSLWHIGAPGMISGRVDVLWKERFSIGAGLGANLLRLPIPGVDQSLNAIMGGVRAAYAASDSIWDIHAGMSGVVLWSESSSTPGWRINAGFGTTLYTNRSRTNPRGFFSFDLNTSIDPRTTGVWAGIGISAGIQLQ